jgi:hypothetical protein
MQFYFIKFVICILLIFVWIFLLNLLILNVLVESLELSAYRFISSVNDYILTSLFPIWVSCISFSCMITLSRTSNTMLNKSDESGHAPLCQILKGKLSAFPQSVFFSYGLVIYGLHYTEGHSFYSICLVSLVKGCLILFSDFSASIQMTTYFFILLMWYLILFWFVYVGPALYSWHEYHLVMVNNFFNVLLDSVC